MNAKTAAAILEVAQEGGYFEDAWPDEDAKLIEEGEFYFVHAKGAVESGESNEIIERIIVLGEEGLKDDGFEPEPSPEADDDPSPTPEYIKREHLPTPRQIQGEPPEMPYDISECSDKQIRSIASRFQACLNRTIHLITTTDTALVRANQLREAAYRRAYLAEEVAAREAGVKATKEALDIAARSSSEWQQLDEEAFQISQQLKEYKALKEIYEGNIKLLSREATIRDDEFKRSGRS